MKKLYKLFFMFACGIFFIFSGCDNASMSDTFNNSANNKDENGSENNSEDSNIDNSSETKIYKEIENPAFEDIVRGNTYYSKWFPTMQDTLEFDTDKNIVTYTQYYDSDYKGPLNTVEPPNLPFNYKYIRKSKYLFTEDLKDMALVTFEHYKTCMNGSQRDDFTDFTSEPSALLFSTLTDDGSIIKWNYAEFYTAEAMEELGFANYILHPELIGPKKK